jgi:hypothetical protein
MMSKEDPNLYINKDDLGIITLISLSVDDIALARTAKNLIDGPNG